MKKIALIVAAGLGLVACQPKAPLTEEQVAEQLTAAPTEARPQGAGLTGPLSMAIAAGLPYSCTYTVSGQTFNAKVKGESYYGTAVVQNKTMQTIVKDDCMWSWDATTKKGTTVCFKPEPGAVTPGATRDVWDNPDTGLDAKIQYDCSPAVIPDSTFNPPPEVQFTDLSAMMPGKISPEALEKLQDLIPDEPEE